MSPYLYLLVDIGCISIPFLCSFENRILGFHRQLKRVVLGILLGMLIFIPWDILFTHLGIWGFNGDYLTGVNLLNLPVEEWLFFICIPYACLFTYAFIHSRVKAPENNASSIILWTFSLSMIVPLITCWGQWYTWSTALAVSVVCALLAKLIDRRKQRAFLITYSIILIPFVISNGILTGLEFWEYPLLNLVPEVPDQIVWYNNDHNFATRIFSIPIEDIFYGFSLIGLCVLGYERLGGKRSS